MIIPSGLSVLSSINLILFPCFTSINISNAYPSSQVLISSMPELGSLNRREIAALVGVAPFCHDSGKRSGTKRIKGGRANVRATLYLATFAAIRCNKTFKKFYQRLIAKGKKYKVAIVATMKKMITVLNIMIKNGTTWNEQNILTQNR